MQEAVVIQAPNGGHDYTYSEVLGGPFPPLPPKHEGYTRCCYKYCDMENKKEQLRQIAVRRYRQGEPIDSICKSLNRSKSWLYKWLNRAVGDKDGWWEDRPTTPKNIPHKTPEAVEKRIIAIRRYLEKTEGKRVGASKIASRLRTHGIEPPPQRTIYRILKRYGVT